jgi:uncharacterized lipoprotein YehR (DUF1307 family)
MEVYKFKKLYNGDILLKKIVIDNINYTIIDKENGDKLLRKITNINITDIADIKNYVPMLVIRVLKRVLHHIIDQRTGVRKT